MEKYLLDKRPLNEPHLCTLHCLYRQFFNQNRIKVSFMNFLLKIILGEKR